VFDYDMNIADAFEAPEGQPPPPEAQNAAQNGPQNGAQNGAMWALYDALAARPLLVLRGAHSDILSAGVAARMAARSASVELVTIAGVGHAPTLDEPEAVAAIARLLARAA
jgi:pimeloyl-ACP methyl ester carboxylesterase